MKFQFIALLLAAHPASAALPYVIDLVPPSDGSDVFLTVTIPAGATASDLSADGRIDSEQGLLKWGPIDPSALSSVSFYLQGGSGAMTVNTAPPAAAATSIQVGEDTDNDGMEDGYERANGLVVGTDDSGLDEDGDGFLNRQEFILQTRADQASDTLRTVSNSPPDSTGAIELRLPLRFSNTPLIVETSTSLSGDLWRSVPFNISTRDGASIIRVPGPFSSNRQFFRIAPRLNR